MNTSNGTTSNNNNNNSTLPQQETNKSGEASNNADGTAPTKNPQEEENRKARRALRQTNLSSNRGASLSSLKSLDSSIKRNTSFVKKLKTLSEDQKDSLTQELNQLNLSKYISEAVTSIVEAKLKPSDINAAVTICSLLHQRYPDFSGLLIPSLVKFFPSPAKQHSQQYQQTAETEQEKNAKLLKKRTVLRLLSELFIVGVYTDTAILFSIFQDLTHWDPSPKDKDINYNNLSLIVSFVRTTSEELLGIKTNRKDKPTESTTTTNSEDSKILTDDQRKSFIDLLEKYFDTVAQYLVGEHKDLRAKERENHHILETKGELPEAHATGILLYFLFLYY